MNNGKFIVDLYLAPLEDEKGNIIGEVICTDNCDIAYVSIEIFKRHRHTRWHMRARIFLFDKLVTDVTDGKLIIGKYVKKLPNKMKNLSSNTYWTRDRKKSHARKRAIRLLKMVEKEYAVHFLPRMRE